MSVNFDGKKILIIIPAYNESKVIGGVISEVKKAGFTDIIVIDDGSSDATKKAAEDAGAKVYSHSINRGKGAAVKTGLTVAQEKSADIVVTMDGDGQHDASDISKVIEPLINGKYDAVLGTRNYDRSHIPLIKLIYNNVGNLFTRVLTGRWISDSQSGFRAYSSRVIELVSSVGDKYEYDSEIIREISRHDIRYIEVPINVLYTSYSQNKPNKQTFANGIKTVYRLIWNIIS